MQKTSAALLSGILLFCSFPPLEWSFCAWLALVPLLYLCFVSSSGKAFRYGLISGLAFWLAGIFWLTRVSYIGWMFISLYCALFMAFFALVVAWWNRNLKNAFNGRDAISGVHGRPESRPSRCFQSGLKLPRSSGTNLIFLFGIPAIWVGLEYARAHLLTGFPWNMLGVSQYACLNLIQCAEWGGVYLVSYLVVMGNTAFVLFLISKHRNFTPEADPPTEDNITAIIARARASYMGTDVGWPLAADSCPSADGPNSFREGWRQGFGPAVTVPAIFLLLLCLALFYGHFRRCRCPDGPETIQIAALQLNVPQQYKWSEEWANDIYRRLNESTAAASRTKPDLIVWPETALPDCIRHDEMSRNLVKEIMGRNIPLLAGSMDYSLTPEGTNYYNSAFLYLPGKPIPQVYNKRHLVAFGEFIPFARYFPFMRSITGIEEDFTPGGEVVVFTMADPRRTFSVLICFEDTLPYLARDCARAGARLLINQTNDAWFDPYWASRQHMIQCVFRCIENRVACLRVTNTGVTCLIDRRGMICSALAPLGREPRAPEVLRVEAAFASAKMPLTFYTRRGDIFAIACAAFSLPLFLGALFGLCRKK